MGAGTTTGVTTGTSGTQPGGPEQVGAGGATIPLPDVSLCDGLQDPAVRENCIEKIAR